MFFQRLAHGLVITALLTSAQAFAAPTPVTTTTSDGTVPGTMITYTITASGTAREIWAAGSSDSDLWSWTNGFPEFVGVDNQSLTVDFSSPVPVNRLVLGVNSISNSSFSLIVSGGSASTMDFDLSDGIAAVGGTGAATYTGATGTFSASGGDQSLMIGSTSTATITSFTLSGDNGGDGYTLFFGTTDAAPLSVQISDATVNETDSPVTLTVSLSAVSDTDVTVDFATSDGTAIAPDDYTSTTGTATILAGEISTTITVPISSDNLVEGDETFNVNLSNPVNAIIADPQAVVTIVDTVVPIGIPTLGQWAMVLLGSLLAMLGIGTLRRETTHV